MKNVNMLEVLIGMKKKGVSVYLTEAGIQEFMKLMQEEMVVEVDAEMENAG